jgi:hypothetical protein
MTNYVVETYATAALCEAAVEAIATSSTFLVVPYKEGPTTNFMLITPAPNKTT